jgi:Ni/Co efflux regulator RcnB
MRRFMISAAIIALIGGTSLATAQDRDHRGRPDRGNAPQATAPASVPNPATGRGPIGERQFREHHDVPSTVAQAQQPGAAGAADAMRGVNRALNGNPSRQDSNRPNGNDRSDRSRDNSGRDFDRRDSNRRDFDRSDRRGPDRRDFDNDRRGRPDFGQRRDYRNFRNYHQNYRASRRFRAPAYRRPPGFYARRWSWGETLPFSFWARDYWLNDFSVYDLPPPPYGAVWVRVGDDALLIDRDTGEIIEVEYGVFY